MIQDLILQLNLILFFTIFSDADDATHDLDGKDMQGGRVRVELARDPRDRRGGGGGGGGGGRFGGGGGGGGGGRFGGRDGGRPRGNPPGPRTNYRLVVENLSSRTSWQVMFYLYISNWENCAKVENIF